MKTINILARVYGFDDALFVDVARKRELHDKAVNIFILIELMDALEQFGFGDIIFVANEGGVETTCFTSQDFVADIRFTSAIVSHKYGSKMGRAMTFGSELLHLLGYFCFDLCGKCFAVNESGWHKELGFRMKLNR